MQAMGGLSGRRLAGYELGAYRGEDGFGPLYEARHLNLGRTFTMRVLSDQFTFAQGFEEAFLRVAQVLSTLEHANLLTLDDFGVDGPYAYLVTPLVEGMTLDAWLRQRPGQPINPAQVIRLFGQMLAGLAHAHQTGVTHLGLEPRHFLLQPNGHVLVANFGLPYLAEQLWITWNNKRSFGDPIYLAPEQISGRTPFGVAADLYTLGIILYRLLTGSLPFEGPEQAIVQAKLAGPPPLRAANASLPADLEAIVRRTLAPAPADRWTSMEELGAAFYQALGQENPMTASPLPAGPARGVSLLLPPGETAAPGMIAGAASAPGDGGDTPLGRRGVRRVGRAKIPGGRSGAPAARPASPPAGGKALSFSSAGKGRISVPPPPPGWNAEESASANDFPPPKSLPRRLLSALVRVVILLITLAILGGAIFYGYQRWSLIQHQQVTPTPIVTPTHTPTHR